MVASVIKDQHILSRLDVAGDDVPSRYHQFIALFEHLGVRQATSGNNHNIRIFSQYRFSLSPSVEIELHT
ncbi:hypothetical protein D3C73_1585680 [compost metagenome]